MLILTRKTGQNLVIGDTVVVKVLEVKGDTVKIGIEAPKDIKVYRQEVHELIRQANQNAALQKSDRPGLQVPKPSSDNNDLAK